MHLSDRVGMMCLGYQYRRKRQSLGLDAPTIGEERKSNASGVGTEKVLVGAAGMCIESETKGVKGY